MLAQVIEMSVDNLLYHSTSSAPLLFYHFSCPHLFYEKRILQIQVHQWFILQNDRGYSSQWKQRMLAFFKLLNIGKQFSIVLKKKQLGNDFWLSIRTILSIFSVLLKNKLQGCQLSDQSTLILGVTRWHHDIMQLAVRGDKLEQI